jgi:hypothetical protein
MQKGDRLVMNEPNFWSDGDDIRNFCYMFQPISGIEFLPVDRKRWEELYWSLGGRGYKFFDAGYGSGKMVVALDKPISEKHIGELIGNYLIQADNGSELGFC